MWEGDTLNFWKYSKFYYWVIVIQNDIFFLKRDTHNRPYQTTFKLT